MADVDINSLKERKIPGNLKKSDLYLDVDIKSRKKEYYRGQATTLTSINDTGEFDVLPYHANFITLIRNYIILNERRSDEQRIEIDTGVLSVQDNEVKVYLDL